MSRARAAKAHPATLLDLSANTRAVVSKAGVSFIRGREAFTLNDAEYDRLILWTVPEPTGASEPAAKPENDS